MPSLTALRCVACGSPGLEPGPDLLDCPNCSRSYPIVADVPVMFSDATRHRGPLLAPAVVRTVLRAMGVPADAGNALRIRRASGACARYGDQLVAAESAQFLRRVHASGYPIPSELLGPSPQHAESHPVGGLRCAWITDYIPRAMPPGEARLANIRFANTGTATLPSQGPGRIEVAFTWRNDAGEPVATEDYRTPLPVDLPPGQALTLPVRVVPPAAPGIYHLTLRLLCEGMGGLQPEYGPLRITLREDAGFTPPPHWQLNTEPPSGYVADQERGAAILSGWLPAGGGVRLLEIGGNAKPVLAHFPGEHYNVDVDLLGLQVGHIVQPARRRAAGLPGEVGFICADAHHLPFAEGFFDAIIMFASLHHVPQPAEFLRRLRSHLRPGGFIGVFCEPIGHIWPGVVDPAYAAELEHGVNEQGFSLAEYAQIFDAAGLHAAALVADYNSLKARLEPVAPHA